MTRIPMPAPAEPPTRPERRLIQLTLWLALALGLFVVALTYQDYGITWDEGVQARYGELALRYFESGFQDTSSNSYKDLRYYGPLVEMAPAMIYDADRPGKYEVRHLFLALLAVLSIPALWGYGRLFDDPRVAVFLVIAVVTLPRFYGHWFNNSKDIPFAVLVTWFMYALAAMFSGPAVRWPRVIGCGVALGLTLCARPGGFPLLSLFVVGAAVLWLLTRGTHPGGASGWRALGRLVPSVLAVFLIAWPIMVLPWPWAHENILLNPLKAMWVAASFTSSYPVLFEGKQIPSDGLPWYYVIKYLLITTPLTVLLLALLGLVLGVRDQVAGWRSRRSRMVALTQMWLFLPLVLFVLLRPNIYDGIRHFLFVLPALGALAALGAAGLLRAVRRPRGRLAAWTVLVAVLVLPLKDLVRLHPYQMTYYNPLVGGVRGASGRYWTDYWLSSYREAILWANDRASRSAGRPVVAVIAANPYVMLWVDEYSADNVEMIPVSNLRRMRALPEYVDFYIATTRYGLDRRFPDSPIVHTIGRDGAVFTVIKGHAERPAG